MRMEIKQLPSGFWSVWINGSWINASCGSEAEARQVLETYMRTMKRK